MVEIWKDIGKTMEASFLNIPLPTFSNKWVGAHKLINNLIKIIE